jgi:hypothetical protein
VAKVTTMGAGLHMKVSCVVMVEMRAATIAECEVVGWDMVEVTICPYYAYSIA